MINENGVNTLRLFGRFPKKNFDFDSQKFIDEYMKIISSPELTDELMIRMIYRYGTNELKKAAIVQFVRETKGEGLTSEKLWELFECDKNTIFAIGQEMETSIRLLIQQKFYAENGRKEIMIDEFGFTPRTFNYIYKRGYMTKSAMVEAYKNGYISNEKVREEIRNSILNVKNKNISTFETEKSY
ncbi:MAG: hypothetical protein IJX17_02850 [Clostridia bacterium]|nr:hypothetical protein [Clostridia bacterium]